MKMGASALADILIRLFLLSIRACARTFKVQCQVQRFNPYLDLERWGTLNSNPRWIRENAAERIENSPGGFIRIPFGCHDKPHGVRNLA